MLLILNNGKKTVIMTGNGVKSIKTREYHIIKIGRLNILKLILNTVENGEIKTLAKTTTKSIK